MKKRILITDADELFCEGLIKCLKRHDTLRDALEVIGVANDGEQTIRMIKQLKPDVLVLDLMLTKKDGIAVLKEIHSMEKRPVVVATSKFINDYVATSAVSLGVRYLMLKPCDMEALAERIEESCFSGKAQTRVHRNSTIEIEELAIEALRNVGVPAHIKGYHYLFEAIVIAVEDADAMNALTKVLYPQIAKTYKTTPTRVARAIRHAIEISWDRREQNALHQFFDYTASNTKGKPTSAEFISLVADQIRPWMSEKADMLK